METPHSIEKMYYWLDAELSLLHVVMYIIIGMLAGGWWWILMGFLIVNNIIFAVKKLIQGWYIHFV